MKRRLPANPHVSLVYRLSPTAYVHGGESDKGCYHIRIEDFPNDLCIAGLSEENIVMVRNHMNEFLREIRRNKKVKARP